MGLGDYGLAKLEIKPSIQEQMNITEEWWKEISGDDSVPLNTVKRFMVRKNLAADQESAGNILERFFGKIT